MKDELEELFEEYPNKFVTVCANVDSREIGSYDTTNYSDLDRLYDDMLRQGIEIEDIYFEAIKDNTQESLYAVLTNIELLQNKLASARSAYKSAQAKRQAVDANLHRFAEKQKALKAFVSDFNAGKNNEKMELYQTYSTKIVLNYKHNGNYCLKEPISLYDELDPILENVTNGIKLYRQLDEILQESAYIIDDYIIIYTDDWSDEHIIVKPYNNYYKVTYKVDDSNVTETVSYENLNDKLIEIIKSLSE